MNHPKLAQDQSYSENKNHCHASITLLRQFEWKIKNNTTNDDTKTKCLFEKHNIKAISGALPKMCDCKICDVNLG